MFVKQRFICKQKNHRTHVDETLGGDTITPAEIRWSCLILVCRNIMLFFSKVKEYFIVFCITLLQMLRLI